METMSVPAISVTPAPVQLRPAFEQLVQLYLHDLSAVGGWDVGDDGAFRNSVLDGCWSEPKRHPHVIRVGGVLAGFAIVDRTSGAADDDDQVIWDMAEFFILRRWRRSGVGRAAAAQLLSLFPGRWEIRPFPGYLPASRFWEVVVDVITDGASALGSCRATAGDQRPVLQLTVADAARD